MRRSLIRATPGETDQNRLLRLRPPQDVFLPFAFRPGRRNGNDAHARKARRLRAKPAPFSVHDAKKSTDFDALIVKDITAARAPQIEALSQMRRNR